MRFVIRRSSNDQYYFNIVSDNGQVVATSETYRQKASAVQTVHAIRGRAANCPVVDLA